MIFSARRAGSTTSRWPSSLRKPTKISIKNTTSSKKSRQPRGSVAALYFRFKAGPKNEIDRIGEIPCRSIEIGRREGEAAEAEGRVACEDRRDKREELGYASRAGAEKYLIG